MPSKTWASSAFEWKVKKKMTREQCPFLLCKSCLGPFLVPVLVTQDARSHHCSCHRLHFVIRGTSVLMPACDRHVWGLQLSFLLLSNHLIFVASASPCTKALSAFGKKKWNLEWNVSLLSCTSVVNNLQLFRLRAFWTVMWGRYQCFLSIGAPRNAGSKSLRIKLLKMPPADVLWEEVQHLWRDNWWNLWHWMVFVMPMEADCQQPSWRLTVWQFWIWVWLWRSPLSHGEARLSKYKYFRMWFIFQKQILLSKSWNGLTPWSSAYKSWGALTTWAL